MTLLAEYAVVAPPVVLELLSAFLRIGKAIRVETLTTQITAEEVLFVSKGTTEVAHLLKDQGRIIK